MSFVITTGSTVIRFSQKRLNGDKGYISEQLVAWLKEKGLNLVTKVRKNMKPKALKAFDKAMLRKGAVIEGVKL